MYAKQIGAYQKSDVLTADPMRLVLMCYNATIKNLKLAKTKYQEKEFEAKGKAVQKAVDVISELIMGLDYEKGGNISKNLDALYRYMIRQINLADVKEDLSGFDEVIDMLIELEDAWKQAVAGKRKTIDTIDEGRKQAGAWA
jgi:flagellar secretion chaperone FliS